MDNVGKYIEYNGETHIILAFDGTEYWLISEEKVAKPVQTVGEMFVKVSKEEIDKIIEQEDCQNFGENIEQNFGDDDLEI